LHVEILANPANPLLDEDTNAFMVSPVMAGNIGSRTMQLALRELKAVQNPASSDATASLGDLTKRRTWRPGEGDAKDDGDTACASKLRWS